jgi:hypothetical protein
MACAVGEQQSFFRQQTDLPPLVPQAARKPQNERCGL